MVVSDLQRAVADKYRQLWRPRHAPPPPKASLADASELPLASANFVSKMTFHVSPREMGYLTD